MRTFTILVAWATATTALGQPPDLNSPRNRAIASGQVAAGQLLAELRTLSFNAGPLPPHLQTEIRRRCDAAAAQVKDLYRTIQTGANWATFQTQIAQVDVTFQEFNNFARQALADNRGFTQAMGRVNFAWQRTQAELTHTFAGFNPVNPGGPPPGQQQKWLVGIARGLERQADALYDVARETLPNDRWGDNLERAIRNFSRSADALRSRIERGEAFDVQLADIRTRWDGLAQVLNGVQVSQFPAVRAQAARVDQLYRTLLQAVGQAQVPQFPINNLKLNGVIAIGAGDGGVPVVRVFQDRLGGQYHDFMAYDPDFQGGVRVAVGDVNGDGVTDVVTAPGPGMPPIVRVFDGRDYSLMSQFYAYDPRFLSGVFVAAGDVTGSGRAEIVTGAGDPGGPHVRAFDGITGRVKAETFAYDQRFNCGARVALGDVDGDRIPDVVVAPGAGHAPLVRVFSGRNLAPMTQFLAYEEQFQGGVFVAAADVNRRGRAEVITGTGVNGGPHVRVFDPTQGRLRSEFFAYDRSFLGGVRVAVCDAVGDGRPDVITAPGPGMPPIIRIFRNRDGRLEREFSAFDPNFTGGAWVAGN